MERKFLATKLFQYFLQGLLVMAPVAITVYALYFIVSSIDSLIPIFTFKDESGRTQVQNYGLGFIIVIIGIVLIGYFSSFFITSKIINFFDHLMEKTPGIKHIYTTSRDFVEAFAGDKKKFTKNVLANIDDTDVWRVGFITKDDMADFGLKNYVAVYVPLSYSVAGNVYVVPRSRVKAIHGVSSTQTMKFAVSGGVTDVPTSAVESPTEFLGDEGDVT